MQKISVWWIRRDMRLEDNPALTAALQSGQPVLPVFIFDTTILNKLDEKQDARVLFIHRTLQKLNHQLKKYGSSVLVMHGEPIKIWRAIIRSYPIAKVFFNRDYEPYARERDKDISHLLATSGISHSTFKDHVIFEPDEILKDDGNPYQVFTPYSKKWLKAFNPSAYQAAFYKGGTFLKHEAQLPSLDAIGFEAFDVEFPEIRLDDTLISNYEKQRDYPGKPGTSRISIHLRFGTISIREVIRQTKGKSKTYLNELIWREFYQMILWHYPEVIDKSFKPKYDNIEWQNDEKHFDAWCKGQTGYPIVDAGMRELNQTGYMHNRVRMITASFLTKHLLIDWRWGEAYFAKKLLDYELASNNGGWQWASGSGCDAAPYFRIFNPYSQTKKFDPQHAYIKKWVPELNELTYPEPIVDHKTARERALKIYKSGLNNA